MTEKFNKTEIFDKEHIHLGGKIYKSDFNTNYRGKDNINGSTIASRIAADFQWEKNISAMANKTKYININESEGI